MINILPWLIICFILIAVTILLLGVFHYLNKYLKDGLYEEPEDEDYNEYMIWKKL